MTNLFLLAFAFMASGPIKIDGVAVPPSGLVTSGSVVASGDAVTVSGGRIQLSEASQRSLDAKLATSGSLILSLVDGNAADTTAMTFGAIRLVKKLNHWYIVNTTGGQWRQIDLGATAVGSPLKLALIESGSAARIYANGKDFGVTPVDASSSQPLALGSPSNETTAWKGDIRDFDVLSKTLSNDDLNRRFRDTTPFPVPTAPVVPTIPTTTNTNPTTPTTSVPTTSQTVVTAQLVDFTVVPDPEKVLPYRHVLVTHEYKVLTIKSGHLVDIGATIRVARWGIVSSQKTEIAKLNKGDQVELTLEKYTDHPSLEHFRTEDTLPDNFSAPYLIDVSRTAPSG